MKILFISSTRLGDAVLSTGLLAHLVHLYPNAKFTIAAGPVAADIFKATPGLEKLIILKKQSYNRHWLKLWKACFPYKWDLVVDLRNSLISRLLFAKQKGYPPARSTGQHKVIDNAQALKLSPAPAPHIFIDAENLKKADQIFQTIDLTKPVLALGPSANWPPKQWPAENFAALAQKLISANGPLAGGSVLLIAAPNEKEQLAPLFAALPSEKIIDVVGQNLLTIAACLSKATLYIGNDSGLMHLAAAVNIRVLGLFGPGYENIYGPYGPRNATIRTPETTQELLAKLPAPGARTPNLMQTLSIETVAQTASNLLNR